MVDHHKYVIHYRTLKYLIELGVIVKKAYRIISFKQRPWLKAYINSNTDKKKDAKHDFEKNFFKLMNKSVFGKFIETFTNYMDMQLTTDPKKAMNHFFLSKLNFKNRNIY